MSQALSDTQEDAVNPNEGIKPNFKAPRPLPKARKRPGQGAETARKEPGEPAKKKLTGPEKAAIIFQCLNEDVSYELSKNLDDIEIRKMTRALAGLGKVSAETVEEVIGEFTVTMQNGGDIVGSLRVAENFLRMFLPEDKVMEILNDLRGPIREHDIWKRVSAINENTIANYLKGEHDQTTAAILSNLDPDAAARILPMLGKDRMEDVLERMIKMDSILPVTMQQIEQTLQSDIMSGAGRSQSAGETQQKMAQLFNKFDRTLFENITPSLEGRVPEEFAAIRKRMFTFNDMIKLDTRSIAIVIKGIQGNILPLALRGANKDLREHFLAALPSRARDMLVEEMNTMGPVRMRDVNNAQGEIVDFTRELAENEVIFLPTGDESDALL